MIQGHLFWQAMPPEEAIALLDVPRQKSRRSA
jgi:hypothetical protein